MKITDVQIGTRLEIEIINRNDAKIGLTHISQLERVTDSENAVVLCPIYLSKYVFFALGTRIRVTFYYDKYKSLISFIAAVTKNITSGNIMLLNINITSDLEKLQRRNYFRVDCNLDVQYRLLPDGKSRNADGEDTPLPEFKTAITKNVSGNGAGIMAMEEIPTGTLLEVNIALSPTLILKTKCRVVRVIEVEIGKLKRFETGLYFVNITSKGQDDIVKFIFERQKELFKKDATKK